MEKRMAAMFIVAYMCLLPALGIAGETNLNWLDLTPTSSDSYSLEVNDTSASAVLTIDGDGDVLFAETGGSTSDADFEVDGYARFDGTVELASTVVYAATKRLWFPASAFKLPASAPASASEEGSVGTLKFAEASADDHAWLSVMFPNDCDESASASMYVVYCLDADATETAGTWNFYADVLSDGDTVSASTTDLTTVYDTPQDALKLNVTTATTIPAAQIVDDSVTAITIYQDIDDGFGDEAQLFGVYIEYTSDTP